MSVLRTLSPDSQIPSCIFPPIYRNPFFKIKNMEPIGENKNNSTNKNLYKEINYILITQVNSNNKKFSTQPQNC